jgi:hypothetical protein
MRRSLTRFMLLMFVCALPLQAYAQACEMHCALMKADAGMTDMENAPQKSDDNAPCAQTGLCKLASNTQLVLSTALIADVVSVSSPPITAIEPVADRVLSPLDRPPISS